MISRERALQLVHEHVKTPNIVKHLLATKALMKALARKFQQDEERNHQSSAGVFRNIVARISRNLPRRDAGN